VVDDADGKGGPGGADWSTATRNPKTAQLTERDTPPTSTTYGQFAKYDSPGRDFIPDGESMGIHETYLGWARGSDGSYDEDTIIISVRIGQ
jgi:hypothetical protein